MPSHVLASDDAGIVYDVHGPLPTADGRPPLMMIGQPMDASGFRALVERFEDRTAITYDPRGLGRSTRYDGRDDNVAETQADDVHRVIAALGAGPVDLFASSGGAVVALRLVAAYPDDVHILVAHEPPLSPLLPDADAAAQAGLAVRTAYRERGWGAGMAEFVQMGSWSGEFTDAFFAQPAADPAAVGLPTGDDGSRDDPLLSDRSDSIVEYRPDFAALAAAPTRIVVAAGEETGDTITARTARAVAEGLEQDLVIFPSHHGGFVGGEFGWPGKPDEFAVRLREVLNEQAPAGISQQ